MKRYNRGRIVLQERRDSDRLIAGGGKRRRCGEGSRFCRLLEAGPSTVRSSTKAANDRNQEHRRTRDRAHTQAHSIPAHVRPFMHTVKTCMTPHTHSTHTPHTLIYILAVRFQARTKWSLLQRNWKEKQEDTEQKVCSATSNIYSGAAVLSKHYASELLRN